MKFADVIGQEEVKDLLRRQVRSGRLPHALLFSGPEGTGKLAMAAALAQYLLCQNPQDEDACGICPACRQIARAGHPDLHFSYPIISKSSTTTSETYRTEWTEMTQGGYYFGLNDWLERLDSGNKQGLLTEAESDRILDKLSIASYEGGYKIMIIWQPERMNQSAANNLLKMLEEPAPKTLFILVSNDAGKLLETIVSRTQQIEFRPLSVDTLSQALQQRNGVDATLALQVARLAGGSYLGALRHIHAENNSSELFEQFVALMRLGYSRDLPALQRWADTLATWTRDKQKAFLEYSQNMVRENFIYNLGQPELNFMTEQEAQFAQNFARFINERNVRDFVSEFAQVARDAEQNVNMKTAFFDFALKVIILLRK